MVIYMCERLAPSGVDKRAREVVAAINELKNQALVPIRNKGYAPQEMSATLLVSITKLWRPVFQCHHGSAIGGDFEPANADFVDCLAWVDSYADYVDHKFLPPIAMYHSPKDPNCPIENTRKFRNIFTQEYPVHKARHAILLTEASHLKWKYLPPDVREGEARRTECTW
jgi:hypothetical protein